MATTFSYVDGSERKHTLFLRHNPYNVNWTYNLNTNVIPTYTGEVVQVLSVNIDHLVIDGQLGIEGPFGRNQVGNRLVERGLNDQFSYNGKYVGLHGMSEFFRQYFSMASQGGDATNPNGGQFVQHPMLLSYDVTSQPDSRFWPKVIPTSFPSFRRANDNFAPLWRVECEVWEADYQVQKAVHHKALDNLQRNIGYKSGNAFSDPSLNQPDVIAETNRLIDGFQALLPTYTRTQLRDLIWNDVSAPRLPQLPPG